MVPLLGRGAASSRRDSVRNNSRSVDMDGDLKLPKKVKTGDQLIKNKKGEVTGKVGVYRDVRAYNDIAKSRYTPHQGKQEKKRRQNKRGR